MKITFYFTSLILLGCIFKSNGQIDNTFTGVDSGATNTGNYNCGFGRNSLIQNTSSNNSGFGVGTLSVSTGGYNCAFGYYALNINGSGTLNCAFGTRSLSNNDTGSYNIAIGHRSMEANSKGNFNTAVGYASLATNIGTGNVALGCNTPRNLLTGDSNIFIGTETAVNLINGNNNVFLGKIVLARDASTDNLAGNDTNSTMIFADGAGNQRLFISKLGNAGIGLGNNIIPLNKLDIKGGVAIGRNYTPNNFFTGVLAPTNGLLVEGAVGIGTTTPSNKVEITQGTLGNSGLRFTNLTSAYNPPLTQTASKFLSVNAAGDVVLQNMTNPVSSNSLTSNVNLMTSNVNGITSSATMVNSISNAINAGNQLVTTVNGVASAPVTLPIPNFTEIDGSAINELQTLSQSGNTITLSNGGGSFTLPTFTDTDSQSLSLTGNILAISNGNSVTLPTQVPQTLTQSGNTVSLSNGGGSFTLPTFTDADSQSLSLTGNTLSISNGNSVTLPAQVSQTLTQSGNTVTLSNGGGSFTLPTQVTQTLTQAGNTITLSNGGGSFTMPTTSVVGGTNVTVTGAGTIASPFQVSALDTSLYANNGVINQATTTNSNRVVDMNNSNIWFNSANSTSNGKIYIGSTSVYPNTTGNYKLFVEGGILTEKVKVALRSSSNWADYVFDKKYDLMPLKEVAEYIAANKHLPGIDSADDLAKNGLDVSEMQAKQMAKIEELTLYIIDQNKAIENQNKEIEELKNQVKALISKN
ncbi:beta strand repeat-containing protein [Flavobacterium sp.]